MLIEFYLHVLSLLSSFYQSGVLVITCHNGSERNNFIRNIPHTYLGNERKFICHSAALFIIDLSLVIVILLEIKIIWVMLHFRKQHDKLLPEVAECICIIFERLLTILSSCLKNYITLLTHRNFYK